ncbi:MAG: hypothetical protein J6L76_03765 [Clostridia bacterium]|nr:hypothetical protein [Clostridia bacterium]
MFKRALLYVLILATVTMVCLFVFVLGYGTCTELYEGIAREARAADEEILEFVGLPQGEAAVIGQYTEGTNAGNLFFRIYGPHISGFVGDDFGVDGAALTLQQVFTLGNEIHLICLVSPRGEDAVSYGAVYKIDRHGIVQEPTCYQEPEDGSQYGFNRFVCANQAGQAYAGIQNQRVTIFNKEGNIVLRLNSEQTREIYDVRCDQTGALIAGCTSESGMKETVHRAFCAFYDLEGNRIWRKAVAGEEGSKATVIKILDHEQGNWLLHGVNRVEDLNILRTQGLSFVFESAPHGEESFFMEIDRNGAITKEITYPSPAPILVSQGLSTENGLLLRAYTAQKPGADRYGVQMVRLNRELKEIARKEIPVWGDQVFYCAPWAENAADGIWVYHAGQAKFFQNEREIFRHFTGLMRWRPVCEAALSMGDGALWFLCLYTVMTLCTLGVARSPHSRYYGTFGRKKRRV